MVSCSVAQKSQLLISEKLIQENNKETRLHADKDKVVLQTHHDTQHQRPDKDLKSKSSIELNNSNKEERQPPPERGRTATPKPRLSFENELTFAPKLNSLSLRLAKSKATVTERIKNGYEYRVQALEEQLGQAFTFKPNINVQSSKIAEKLNSDFWARQQQHLSRQKKLQEKSYFSGDPKAGQPAEKQASQSENSTDGENEVDGNEDMPKSIGKSVQQIKRKKKREAEVVPVPGRRLPSVPVVKEKHPYLTSLNESLDDGLRRKKLSKISKQPKATDSSVIGEKACPEKHAGQGANDVKPKVPSLRSKAVEEVKVRRHDLVNQSLSTGGDESRGQTRTVNRFGRNRTQTYPNQGIAGPKPDLTAENFLQAKRAAEKAVQEKKVFLCIGPYHMLRQCMRRRGWVEKYFKADIAYRSAAMSKKRKNESDQSDDDSQDVDDRIAEMNEDCKTGEEPGATEAKDDSSDTAESNRSLEDGCDSYRTSSLNEKDGDESKSPRSELKYENKSEEVESVNDFQYWIMSRIVRNCVPTFIWTCKRDDIDFKYLQKDQIVNHYVKAGSFTTKAGLCVNLRNLPWFEHKTPHYFFPRCHRLSSDHERLNFIDDFRITAAISILKIVVQRHKNLKNENESASAQSETNEEISVHDPKPVKRTASSRYNKVTMVVPSKAIALAKRACTNLIKCREHDDIEESFFDESTILPQVSWDELIEYFYQIAHHDGIIAHSASHVDECNTLLEKIRSLFPQMNIDGTRNIWIVKPGAKSRGRGIIILDRLQEILSLVNSNVSKRENRLVVQKYIERPLLIYNTKFDIRQWYLVTDWNPLTIWFYQKCYLRFCGQEFTFDKFDPQYHLANNSIQKHYKNGERSPLLPNDNMWTCDQFKNFLRSQGKGRVWEDIIYPNMKKAIIYSLECCQDDLEYRKNSFELYGADFILGEDYHPWLLEINCSPAMGASTAVTERLCAQVIDDMLKVVIDRRENKNCHTGHFELIYKQPYISVPPYIGASLAVEGEAVKKPAGYNQQSSPNRLAKTTKLKEIKSPQSENETPRSPEKDNEEAKILKTEPPSPEKSTTHLETIAEMNEPTLGKRALGLITNNRLPPRTAPEPLKPPLKRVDFSIKRSLDAEYRLNTRYTIGDLHQPSQIGSTPPIKPVSAYHFTTAHLEFTHNTTKDNILKNQQPGLRENMAVPERLTRQALKACRGIKRQAKIKDSSSLLRNPSQTLSSLVVRPSNSVA